MNLQETREGFRLSPQQRLRWQTQLPSPSITLDIEGPLDRQGVHRALVALVERHETLRLDLQPSPGLGVPLQIIGDRATAAQRVQWDEGQETVADTRTGIGARLETLETGRQRLHLRLPPLGADRGTLLRLAEALAAPPVGDPDPDELSYNQYASWLYELQADEDAAEGRRYWDERGDLAPSSGELFYREPRRDTAGNAVVTLPAGTELDHALDVFCASGDHAPDEVLITAWGLLLQRLASGPEDEASRLILNWMHDCRDDYEELANCWGLFSKGLPLAWGQALAGSFGDALARMRHCREEASEWQEYYAIDTDPEAAFCRYGFEWGGRLAVQRLGEGRAEVVALQAQTQPCELLLVPEQAPATGGTTGYRLNLHYDAGCYSPQAALTLLEQYRSLLRDALADPSRPLRSLSLHSPAFVQRLQALEVPQPLPALGQDDLFPARFSRRASELGNAIALCDRDRAGAPRQLSYGELERRSNRLAHHLRALGIGPESRVALYLERSSEMLVAMLAVLKSGAAFLPLEPGQPAARTLAMLEAATPALILGHGSGQPPCPPGTAHLDLDAIGPLADRPDTPPEIVLHPDDAAYVLFTSGSTGTPKGVVVAHRQLYHYVTSILARLDLRAGAKSALATSLAADLSYTLLFPALLSGGELHLIDRDTALDPQAWAAYQGRHAIDNLKIVPSLLDAWLGHPDPAAVLPRHQLILGGEACPPALLHRIRTAAPALGVYNHYGPTEATVGVLMHKLDATLDYRQLPLSERLDHMRIHLLDGELEPVACGQPGELYLAGPQLARGYLDPQQTAERFLVVAGERLYRTGDLARYRPDGGIELIGRADRQVKIRGFRIELDEIETLLSDLPGVRRAAVVAVPRPQGELRLFAFVSPAPGQSLSLARLQGQLQDRLPDPMLPTLRLVEELPLLANGKLDRRTLGAQAGKLLDQACGTPPRTPLETLLADLWAEVLGLERIGVDDDFFALGGHSLAAVKLASRLQQSLSAPVTVNAVFSAPTVARFADLAQRELQPSPLVALSPATDDGQDGAALFCFHPSTGHVQDYRPLAGPLAPWRLWGLQADYLSDTEAASPAQSLEALAAGYVQRLRRQQPTGPYYLLGWSLGGLLALSAAAQLESAGETVAFVGVVDSQLSPEVPTEDVVALLQALDEELDADSRARLQQLPAPARDRLMTQLGAAAADERPFLLVDWAQQQGLQLENDSWQHMRVRLRHHRHTQRLIASFRPPRLRCTPTIWWASETLDAAGTAPVDWQQLTGSPVSPEIIEADHLSILQQPLWQRQLRDRLHRADQAPARPQSPGRTPEPAITDETI